MTNTAQFTAIYFDDLVAHQPGEDADDVFEACRGTVVGCAGTANSVVDDVPAFLAWIDANRDEIVSALRTEPNWVVWMAAIEAKAVAADIRCVRCGEYEGADLAHHIDDQSPLHEKWGSVDVCVPCASALLDGADDDEDS